jgi:hypothetical protein
MAYKMYEWLQTSGSWAAISESGYIPVGAVNSIPVVGAQNINIFPISVSDGFHVNGLTQPGQLSLIDTSGHKVLSKQVIDDEYISLASLQKGLYIVTLSTEMGMVQRKILRE